MFWKGDTSWRRGASNELKSTLEMAQMWLVQWTGRGDRHLKLCIWKSSKVAMNVDDHGRHGNLICDPPQCNQRLRRWWWQDQYGISILTFRFYPCSSSIKKRVLQFLRPGNRMGAKAHRPTAPIGAGTGRYWWQLGCGWECGNMHNSRFDSIYQQLLKNFATQAHFILPPN